jgi:hypothetical protein
VEIDRKDANFPRRLSDPAHRPPSPGGASAATAGTPSSGKKEAKRGSVFGTFFDRKEKDKDSRGAVEKEAPATAPAAVVETTNSSSTSASNGRFKMAGNFFDFEKKEKDKDSKGAVDSKEHDATAMHQDSGKEATPASTASGNAASASSSRFKLNLNLGFGHKESS